MCRAPWARCKDRRWRSFRDRPTPPLVPPTMPQYTFGFTAPVTSAVKAIVSPGSKTVVLGQIATEIDAGASAPSFAASVPGAPPLAPPAPEAPAVPPVPDPSSDASIGAPPPVADEPALPADPPAPVAPPEPAALPPSGKIEPSTSPSSEPLVVSAAADSSATSSRPLSAASLGPTDASDGPSKLAESVAAPSESSAASILAASFEERSTELVSWATRASLVGPSWCPCGASAARPASVSGTAALSSPDPQAQEPRQIHATATLLVIAVRSGMGPLSVSWQTSPEPRT